MIHDKAPHPGDSGIEAPVRENAGRFRPKALLVGATAIVLIGGGLYTIAGITGEVREPKEPKGLQPAAITAKAPEARPVVIEEEKPKEERKTGGKKEKAEKKEVPKNFKVSVLAFGGAHTSLITKPLLDGTGGGGGGRSKAGAGTRVAGNGGVVPAMAEGTGEYGGEGGDIGGRNAKSSFYTGGGGRSKQGLYHPHSLQPELSGCVLKAGDELVIQNRNPVRTELPGQVRGYVVEDAYGRIFLGNGEIEECIAVAAGSTVMTEVNATGVSRGDMRVQMCATRVDLLGGGIMPMECSPALGQDGSSGVESESDYAWSGVATGILIEAALATVGAFGGLIEGPAGVAVNVGTQGIRGVGSDYVNRELMRPPVLTIASGAIYKIQINSDIAFDTEE